METYKNLKKGTKIGLVIVMALVIIGIVNSVLSAIVPANRTEPNVIVHWVSDLLLYILVAVYAFIGYKKPHGNALRITFFIFSMYILANSIIPSPGIEGGKAILLRSLEGFSALLIAYLSGKLNRIGKNKIIMIFTDVLLLASSIIIISAFPSNIIRILGVLAMPILWTALCFAYTARYEEHKAAGLADKADAKEN